MFREIVMQTEDCSEQKDIERLIAAAIDGGDRSPVGVAKAVGRLVSEGKLSGGERLPTVRTLAGVLRLSPTSVAEAWSALKRAGTIVTDGRRGTFVRDRTDRAGGGRAWRVPVESGVYEVDLSTGTPDPALLPSIGTILETLGADPVVTSYLDRPVLTELEALLLDRWPFVPERLTVVNGALDAVDRLIAASVEMGDRVVVENPTFAPIGDLLERAGAEVIGVKLDEEGIVVEDLAAALGHRPRLLILQPRAHNPTGIGMTAQRAHALAGLLAGTDTLVIEDDHSGAVAGADLHTLGVYLPGQVVHIHSFSKAYGPDLRLAAVGGASEPIEGLIRR
ncbi:MAG: aminotransferase class I/II-fold pyridoxal phosphate-dependent enzyme, partial [Acidimicrobiia bacterium]